MRSEVAQVNTGCKDPIMWRGVGRLDMRARYRFFLTSSLTMGTAMADRDTKTEFLVLARHLVVVPRCSMWIQPSMSNIRLEE